jgi:hypothetical protein
MLIRYQLHEQTVFISVLIYKSGAQVKKSITVEMIFKMLQKTRKYIVNMHLFFGNVLRGALN